jgi:hypothetical protein
MHLLLHPQSKSELHGHYQQAFRNAVELFIVTAYLTDWDESLKLNPDCHSFRVIIGRDFGITRKAACEAVMRWLPAERKGQFMVADQIGGFHPKAVFWKEARGKYFAIVGSSNLTRAAFATNYEANVFCELSADDYGNAKKWVKRIEAQSLIVAEAWLERYKEAPRMFRALTGGSDKREQDTSHVVALKLPRPPGMKERIRLRRSRLAAFNKKKDGLRKLFRRCADGKIKPEKFYEQLPKYWSHEVGDRPQGKGFEISGKHDKLRDLSQSFIRIINANDEDRDDVVVHEIGRLATLKVATRGAFLSEMLCLNFPKKYPVLSEQIRAISRRWITHLHEVRAKGFAIYIWRRRCESHYVVPPITLLRTSWVSTRLSGWHLLRKSATPSRKHFDPISVDDSEHSLHNHHSSLCSDWCSRTPFGFLPESMFTFTGIPNYRYTPSVLRMIRSAHWTALAINDSVLGLGRDRAGLQDFLGASPLRYLPRWPKRAFGLHPCGSC